MTPTLLACGLTLCLTAWLNVLHRAVHVSTEAGLSRLRDRSARSARVIDRWADRAPEISGILLFFAGIAQISAVWFAVNIHDSMQVDPFPFAWAWVVGFTFFFILFVRILPPALSSHYADRFTLSVLPIGGLLSRMLFPIAFLMKGLDQIVFRGMATSGSEAHRPSAEEEILTLVDQQEMDGLEDDEKEIIRSALEFGDTITREIMTPRVNMQGVEDTLSVLQVVEAVMDSPYSRFPVYHEDYDEVLGMVHAKDLIRSVGREEGNAPVTSLMRPPLFVPESMPINDLLQQMRQKKTQTAIAVDEYGGTAGIITLEDILEELVGEIEDEHDEPESLLQKQADGSYLVDPAIPVDEMNEALGLDIPESEAFDSLGGYLLLQFGCIPQAGEVFEANRASFQISAANARKIVEVTVRIAPQSESRALTGL